MTTNSSNNNGRLGGVGGRGVSWRMGWQQAAFGRGDGSDGFQVELNDGSERHGRRFRPLYQRVTLGRALEVVAKMAAAARTRPESARRGAARIREIGTGRVIDTVDLNEARRMTDREHARREEAVRAAAMPLLSIGPSGLGGGFQSEGFL